MGYYHFRLDDGAHEVAEDALLAVEFHRGLVRVDGTRKPAFEAYRQAIASVRGAAP